MVLVFSMSVDSWSNVTVPCCATADSNSIKDKTRDLALEPEVKVINGNARLLHVTIISSGLQNFFSDGDRCVTNSMAAVQLRH
jgi:hypothetical protein